LVGLFHKCDGVVANKMKVTLPAEMSVDTEIDLCNSGDVYFLPSTT
jgi:lipoyl-dependent peroxiredoxin